MTLMIMGLDPSATRTGWAILKLRSNPGLPHEEVVSGVWKSARPDAEEGHRHTVMCGEAFRWLQGLIVEKDVAVLVIEHGGGPRIHRVTERLRGAFMAAASCCDVAVLLVQPARWQRQAATKGWSRADKSDEADATWIAKWGAAVLRKGEVDVSKN